MKHATIISLGLCVVALLACGGNQPPSGVGVVDPAIWEAREAVPVNTDLSDAAFADFDGDRRVDLAVVSPNGELRVLLGQGNGTFLSGGVHAMTGAPSRVVVADLDRDGDIDVAVLRPADQRVSVLLNDGRANFGARPDLDVGPGPNGMAVGDPNSDGRPDLVVIRAYAADVAVFPGLGGGRFDDPFTLVLTEPSNPGAVAVGDVTEDGIDDVLVAESQRAELWVFPGRPGAVPGAPTTAPIGLLPIAIAIGDLDGDFVADVAVACRGTRDVVRLRRAGGGFVVDRVALDGLPYGIALGDVQGNDDRADLVVSLIDRAGVAVLPGLADGTFGGELRFDTNEAPLRPLLGDVDGDGALDLAVAALGARELDLFRNAGSELRGARSFDAGIDTPACVDLADLDRDGTPEIVTGGGGGDAIAVAAVDHAELASRAVVVIGAPVFDLATADLDGDGARDVLVTAQGEVKVLANVGVPGAIALAPTAGDPDLQLPGMFGEFSARVADLDGNELPDLVLTDPAAPDVRLLAATADFEYSASSVGVPVAAGPRSIASGDFTGDGHQDVAVARADRSAVTILAGNGHAQLQAVAEIEALAGTLRLAAADFDRDGRDDLVITGDLGTRALVVLARDLSVAFEVNLGDAEVIHVADLNDDGAFDLLAAARGEAELIAFLGRGNGSFGVQHRFPGPFGATSAAVLDVDGDGRSDLIVGSAETGRLTVHRRLR